MRRWTGILAPLFLIAAAGCATVGHPPVYIPNENLKMVRFEPRSEPQGFNGIRWETELSSLQGMKFLRTDPSHGGIDFYLKEMEVFRLGEGKIRTVQYGFWRDKFYVGLVTTELSHWNPLKEAVFKEFGEGAKPFKNREEYLWVGRNAIMGLQYDDLSAESIFYIRSDLMTAKIWSVTGGKLKKNK